MDDFTTSDWLIVLVMVFSNMFFYFLGYVHGKKDK
jgi:hypothetical protein